MIAEVQDLECTVSRLQYLVCDLLAKNEMMRRKLEDVGGKGERTACYVPNVRL